MTRSSAAMVTAICFLVLAVTTQLVVAKHFRIAAMGGSTCCSTPPFLNQVLIDAKANGLLANHTIAYEYAESALNSVALSAALSWSEYANTSAEPVWGVWGPNTPTQAVIMQQIIRQYGIPQVLGTLAADTLSDKTQYPTITRLTGSDAASGTAIANLMYNFGWKRFSVFYESEFGGGFLKSMATTAASYGIQLLASQSYIASDISSTSTGPVKTGLQIIKDSGAKIFVLACGPFDMRVIMGAATEIGLTTSEYTWIGIYANLPYYVFPVGSLGVDSWFNATEYPLHDIVKNRLIANQPNFKTPWSINTATNYDAMMFLITAIDQFARLWDKCTGVPWASYPAGLSSSNCTAALGSWTDQRWLVNSILQGTKGYVGISGPVVLDYQYNRIFTAGILNQVINTSTTTNSKSVQSQTAPYLQRMGQIGIDGKVKLAQPPRWPDGTSNVPVDRRGIRANDKAPMTLSSVTVVLTIGISVLGSWTSLILLEQALINYQYHALATMAWLGLSSAAVSIALWTAIMVGLSAMEFPALPDSATFSFESLETFASLLIAVPLAFAAYVIVIRSTKKRAHARFTMDTESGNVSTDGSDSKSVDSSHVTSENADSAPLQPGKPSAKKAFSSYFGSLSAIGVSTLIGGVFQLAAIILTHVTIWSGLHSSCHFSLQPSYLIASILAGYVMCVIALGMYFHFRKSTLRFFGAFIMAGAICITHFTALYGTVCTYSGSDPSVAIEVNVIRLTGAVVMTLVAFLFVGLNVQRLKLSRDLLDTYLMKAQKNNRILTHAVKDRDETVDSLVQIIDLNRSLRPLSRRNHFAINQLVHQIAAHETLKAATAAAEGGSPVSPAQKYRPAQLGGTLDLLEIMGHPVAMEILKDHAMASRNGEQIAFYADVLMFKSLPKEERAVAADDILATYIAAGAPNELNIAAVMRDHVTRRVNGNKTSSDAFVDAEREVMTLIRRNVYDSFINTEGYQVCQVLIKSSQVMKSSSDAIRAIRKETSNRAADSVLHQQPTPTNHMTAGRAVSQSDVDHIGANGSGSSRQQPTLALNPLSPPSAPTTPTASVALTTMISAGQSSPLARASSRSPAAPLVRLPGVPEPAR